MSLAPSVRGPIVRVKKGDAVVKNFKGMEHYFDADHAAQTAQQQRRGRVEAGAELLKREIAAICGE